MTDRDLTREDVKLMMRDVVGNVKPDRSVRPELHNLFNLGDEEFDTLGNLVTDFAINNADKNFTTAKEISDGLYEYVYLLIRGPHGGVGWDHTFLPYRDASWMLDMMPYRRALGPYLLDNNILGRVQVLEKSNNDIKDDDFSDYLTNDNFDEVVTRIEKILSPDNLRWRITARPVSGSGISQKLETKNFHSDNWLRTEITYPTKRFLVAPRGYYIWGAQTLTDTVQEARENKKTEGEYVKVTIRGGGNEESDEQSIIIKGKYANGDAYSSKVVIDNN